ncbi:MAG: rRNA maturation RNase YbeY [Phycisphaerales bacterium]|nr:rRNA maturation RNase YbeY [Planctomycetota bacterium]
MMRTVRDDMPAESSKPAEPGGVGGEVLPPELRVDLRDSSGRVPESACVWLVEMMSKAFAAAARREAGRSGGRARGGEVRVRVVNDEEMARLHEEYAGVPGTTDVLTFDLSVDEDGSGFAPLDVDIEICLDEAERQARARGWTGTAFTTSGAPGWWHELLLYGLHGVLHCLGHDDHDPESYRAMHDAEDEILTGIGVGVVFARPARGEGA